MSERKKLLVELTEEDLQKLIVETITQQLVNQNKLPNRDPMDDLIPRLEVAKLFGISLVTLAKWARLKILPRPIKKGGRVFYRRSELNNSILLKNQA